jgi:Ca2+-binding EF-hand superfamily protein
MTGAWQNNRVGGMAGAILRACALAFASFGLLTGVQSFASPPRADVDTTTPLASAALQEAGTGAREPIMAPAALMVGVTAPEDPLDCYQRTMLGDWPEPPLGERDDPWIRLLLLAPKHPVLIDVAVFVDGKPYREGREAWIDGVIRDAKSGSIQEPSKLLETLKSFAPAPERATDAALEGAAGKPDDDDVKSNDQSAPDIEYVATTTRTAPTLRERVLAYAGAAGDAVNRDELHWLLADWGPGPEVVVLNPSLSWERAGDAPLLAYLDGDHDGTLSAEEIEQVETQLAKADANGDEVIDAGELRRLAVDRFKLPYEVGYPLLIVVDGNTDWDAVATQVGQLYGEDESDLSDLAPSELPARLSESRADLSLRVNFGSSAGISMISADGSGSTPTPTVSASSKSVRVAVGNARFEFSAGGGAGETIDQAATQISLGAAIDGGDVTALVDRDGDGRLTRREQSELAAAISELDADKNGAVTAKELPLSVRIAVGQGVVAHRLLASPAVVTPGDRATNGGAAGRSVPDWFAGMDQNNDGDLSPKEFLGASEQFTQLDADGDGLISTQEAAAAP